MEEAGLLHAVQRKHLLLDGVVEGGHTLRGRGVAEVGGVVVLIELDRHRIGAGADQIVLDLLIGALNGGHNGDDGGDADDDAQHRQKGAHFVRPDAFQGKADIF